MAAVFARGLGMVGRRYAPQLMRRLAGSYMRNPAVWQRAYGGARQVAKYAPFLGAASNAAKKLSGYKGSPPGYTSPKKRSRSESTYGGIPNGKRRTMGARVRPKRGFRGKFAGKFPKPSKVNINRQSLTKFSASGVTSCVETTGTVADPDCVYLYSHVHIPERLMGEVANAIARKICEKAFKRNYTNIDDVILGADYSPTLGNILVVVNLINQDTFALTTSASPIDATTTISTLGLALLPVFENYSAGYGLSNAGNGITGNTQAQGNIGYGAGTLLGGTNGTNGVLTSLGNLYQGSSLQNYLSNLFSGSNTSVADGNNYVQAEPASGNPYYNFSTTYSPLDYSASSYDPNYDYWS